MLPKRTLIIAGTSGTLEPALRLLAPAGEGNHRIFGCVVLDETDRAALTGTSCACVGTFDKLAHAIKLANAEPGAGEVEVIICLPRAMSAVIAQLRRVCAQECTEVRVLPTVEDLLASDPDSPLADANTIDLSALIGRDARPINHKLVHQAVAGKRVLITGAGGSIGSELARLCAQAGPSELLLMDRSDNALFAIDAELRRIAPEVSRRIVLHDVVDADGTLRWLAALGPQTVFHAAAHKHVPMMQDHPAAAVNNNLFGTKAIADAAHATGVERFVMISTDKAVNPTSVMGATKRLAELYIRSLNKQKQTFDGTSPTRFTLVRFGNVLGSACSVVPIWTDQLAQGGPLTVTDARMTRYFMTIPEAAALVIQAAAIDSGDVFELDMGEPVRILDLAKRFLNLQGLGAVVEGEQAPPISGPTARVTLTGIRPGEKLYEELAYEAESLDKTDVPGVLAWRGETVDKEAVDLMLRTVTAVRDLHDPQAVIDTLAQFTPSLKGQSSARGLVSPTVRTVQPASSAGVSRRQVA